MKKLLLWLVLFVFALTPAVAQDTNTLTVDASTSLGTISPYFFGANFGYDSVVPPDLMPLAQALGIQYLRLGSGQSDRIDLTKLTLDLMVLQARAMGAEPGVTVRLLGGTPEQAAELVRYANIEKDYNIRYWSIGNEPNFFVDVIGAESYTTEDLNREWRAIAEAMLEIDPDILLVGPDISQYVPLSIDGETITYLEGDLGGDPRDALERDWMQEFLKANGDMLDVVSIHRYPYPGAGGSATASATIEGLRDNPPQWEVMISNLRQIIRQAAGRDIPIAVTEINSNSIPSSGGEAGLDSRFNAVWLADVLGRLLRQQVAITAVWNLRSIGNGFGLLDRYDPRPTYFTYVMYSHFGQELLQASSDDPHVSIYAAQRGDGALTLMVVNLGDDEVTKTLSLTGFTPSGQAEVWRFDTEHNAEQIESVELADGGSITVPGRSITLYALLGS